MSDIQNQKVASAVLASRIDQHVSESNCRQFAYVCALQAAAITRAELEAVLRECLGVMNEIHNLRPLGKEASEYALTVEYFARAAIAKIDEVLNVPDISRTA